MLPIETRWHFISICVDCRLFTIYDIFSFPTFSIFSYLTFHIFFHERLWWVSLTWLYINSCLPLQFYGLIIILLEIFSCQRILSFVKRLRVNACIVINKTVVDNIIMFGDFTRHEKTSNMVYDILKTVCNSLFLNFTEFVSRCSQSTRW